MRTTAGVNMRSGPGTNNAILTVLPINTTCTVLSGPIAATDYQWYQLNCGSRGTGWVAGEYLTLVSAASSDFEAETSEPQLPSATAEATVTMLPTETVEAPPTDVPPVIDTETPMPTEGAEILAPVEASPDAAQLAPVEEPTEALAPEPQSLPIARIQRSEGSSVGQVLVDHDAGTVWMTDGSTVVPLAAFIVDLDAPQYVSVVRWQVGASGVAGTLHVSISTDNENWTDLTVESVGAPGEWQELAVGSTAQYIRFVFVNDEGLPAVGGIAEIEVWP